MTPDNWVSHFKCSQTTLSALRVRGSFYCVNDPPRARGSRRPGDRPACRDVRLRRVAPPAHLGGHRRHPIPLAGPLRRRDRHHPRSRGRASSRGEGQDSPPRQARVVPLARADARSSATSSRPESPATQATTSSPSVTGCSPFRSRRCVGAMKGISPLKKGLRRPQSLHAPDGSICIAATSEVGLRRARASSYSARRL